MSEFADATEALGRSLRLEKAARRGSDWYLRYLAVFAAAQLVLVPAVLLGHDTWVMPAALGLYVVAVAGLSVYATRQRSVRRRFGVRHTVTVAVWGLLYAATLALGFTAFPDSAGFTAVAAVVCSVPLAVGAWLERRQGA
ncbi:hypothetical protein [Streptomyces purpureus]|uniref:Uncharacterized protein n=1 Tax=Streptomyces purpureus TaxID=1951 RepID=A0A918H7M2_9ACTN|nr:hypothetical protein [Streptomyces purpureus]GGT42370.1 hypothetical protein GCM10014713_40110 [Streptomyces purpureus]